VVAANARQGDSPPYAVVLRTIGNDMPPLQGVGQGRRNLEFQLANEPPPPEGVARFWLINRVVNQTEANDLRALLLAYNHSALEIPFNAEWLKGHLQARDSSVRAHEQDIMRYATNINGARNAALQMGAKTGATWVLPLDGTLFFTGNGWTRTVAALRLAESAGRRALKLPMVRLEQAQQRDWLSRETSLRDLVDAGHVKSMLSEPQIAFNVRARVENDYRGGPWWATVYDANRVYGKSDKVAALNRVCATADACHCNEVEAKDDKMSMTELLDTSDRCGWATRLWYFPQSSLLAEVQAGSCASYAIDKGGDSACKAVRSDDATAAQCLLQSYMCRSVARGRAEKLFLGRVETALHAAEACDFGASGSDRVLAPSQ